MELLHDLGWLDNDLRRDEDTYLNNECIDGGYATVHRVLGWVLEDDNKIPAYDWSARVRLPRCRENNGRCWCKP